MAGFNFAVGLQIMLFLFAMWFAGRAFQQLGLPPILGLIGVGLLFGKSILDFVPYATNGQCDSIANPLVSVYDVVDANVSVAGGYDAHGRALAAKAASCDTFAWDRFAHEYLTSIWTFIGNAGVLLMIMESGMHVHFDKMKLVGKKATIVAIVGTGLPILAGYLVTGALFQSQTSLAFFPYGFAAGCSFAPTSVAISIKLLGESKMLNSMAGQTTIAAAFIDDVFSIVTLVILEQVAKGSTSAVSILVPMICCFAFLGLSVALAVYVFPHVSKLLNYIPLKKNVSIQPRDEAQLFLMFATLTVFGWISSISEIGGVAFIGSPLLGAFAAGMSWVNVTRSHAVWTAQLKRIVRWAMRIFFACTVGFAIPVRVMFTAEAVWKGFILGIGPCIATKMVSGLFAWMRYSSEESRQLARSASCITKVFQPQQLLVGFAMVARGEFAYLVAEIARSLEYKGATLGGDTGFAPGEKVYMLSEQAYAAVVWALVLATIVAPFGFKFALKVFDKATPIHRSDFIGGNLAKYARRAFVIRIAGRYSPGLQKDIMTTLHNEGVDVLEAQISSVRSDDTPEAEIELFANSFTVLSRGKKKDFDTEKLEEIHHALSEVLNDLDAQILFEPADEDFSTDGILEIQIMHHTESHSGVVHEITDKLAALGLDVKQGMIHQSLQPGHHHASPKTTPKIGRRSSADKAKSAPAAAAAAEGDLEAPTPPVAATPAATEALGDTCPASEKSVKVQFDPQSSSSLKRGASLRKMMPRAPSFRSSGRSFTQALANVGRRSRAQKRAAAAGGADADHEDHGGAAREVFYAREADGSHLTSAKRRHEIQHQLQQILRDHCLHGEVLVRLVHESEAALAEGGVMHCPNMINRELTTVVRMVGKHHKEVAHLICDAIEEASYDILHADITPGAQGIDTNTFYIQHEHAEANLTAGERAALQATLEAIYREHAVGKWQVSVTEAALKTPPMSPAVKASTPDRRGLRMSKEMMLMKDILEKTKDVDDPKEAAKEAKAASSAFMVERKRRVSKEAMGSAPTE